MVQPALESAAVGLSAVGQDIILLADETSVLAHEIYEGDLPSDE
jgi:hypothetical protein